jgi:hypothetical protein
MCIHDKTIVGKRLEAHRIRVPVVLGAMVVQRGQSCGCACLGQQLASAQLVGGSRGVQAVVFVMVEGIELAAAIALALSVPAMVSERYMYAPTWWSCGGGRSGERRWSLLRRGVDHQHEALLGRGELRDVVLGMCAADVLLHGAVTLLLYSTWCYSWSASWVGDHSGWKRARTPVQRLRQGEPSWLRSGQTTTLFSSDSEKEPVREARGGMASCIYPGSEEMELWSSSAGGGVLGSCRCLRRMRSM